jgi:regulator of cell morphogenesis and NO signaling
MNHPIDNPSQALISLPLASLVRENYTRATVLSKHGLDFCCGGKQSLAEACASKGIEPALVAAELLELDAQAGASGQDFNRWTLPALIEYLLSRHHAYIREVSTVIITMGTKVAQTHGHAAPEAVTALSLFIELAEELRTHLPKEENILFPAMLRNSEMGITHRRDPALAGPIHVMEAEHDHAGKLIHALEEATGNFAVPEWGCNTFRAFYANLSEFRDRLIEHVHIENNILFPQAV